MERKISRRKEKPGMTSAEIKELMDLAQWSRTELAANLKLGEAAIHKWFRQGCAPEAPASVLMRTWLYVARTAGGTELEEMIHRVDSSYRREPVATA
jgi:hypothetical protein